MPDRSWGTTAVQTDAEHGSCGGKLVAADGRELILREAKLEADAGGGLARVVVEQRFANPYDEPLVLVYQLPLPADGAVSGFSFRIGERTVVGEIDRVEAARRRYEDAILQGRTAALLEQDRSSLFTQEIGNVPPRTEVVARITVDQKLRWLGEGAWEWRFPTVVAPRYLGEPGRVPGANRVAVDVLDGPAAATLALELTVRDPLAGPGLPTSPSHAIEATPHPDALRIHFAGESAPALDRDVVVCWPVAAAAIGARLEVAPPNANGRSFGLLTIVPPAPDVARRPGARDVIVLIDASGSMAGRPLEHARAVAQALVRSLDERDSLELIAFASTPLRFRAGPKLVTASVRAEALAWIEKLVAGGGTEMQTAVAAALVPLRPTATREVVLVTDGLVGFEDEIVAYVLRALPPGSRLHTVGVGSAVNRSLTAAAARAGRGVEVIVGLDEEAGAAAERLLAHVAAPLVGEIEIQGSSLRARAPERLRDLTAGAPVLVALELEPTGGALEILGGGFERRIDVSPASAATGRPALAALFAREHVEDLEMRACAGEAVDAEIEAIGLTFAIATRRTSWVAIGERPAVEPGRAFRRARIAQQAPHGLSVEGLRSLADAISVFSLTPLAPYRGKPVLKMRYGMGRHSDLREPAPKFGPARIVSRTGSGLVIEIEVGPEAVRWRPGRLALLTPDDGVSPTVVARVNRLVTTNPGLVEAGLVIRLGLRLDAPLAADPASLVLEVDGHSITLDLRS